MKAWGKEWVGAWLFLFLCGLLASPEAVQGGLQRENVELVKQIGGSALSVTLRGNTAYLGLGSTLHLLDVQDPADPQLKGKVTLRGLVMDVAVLADGIRTYAYVAAGKAGLRVVDVSHPSALREKGSYDTGGYAEEVFVAVSPDATRTYAYLAAGEEGLLILDVSNPTSPQEIGRYETEGYAAGVFVSVRGDKVYAYVAAGEEGLVALDVSDPAFPRLIQTLPLPGYAAHVLVFGDYAYVAAGEAGLMIVDISDPEFIWEVGRYDTEGFASEVAISFPYAYVADGERGLRVIQVEKPSLLVEVGSYRIISAQNEAIPTFAFGVAVSGAYAYLANGRVGLKVVEFLSPTAANEVGEYQEPVTFASGFFAAGSDVCVTAGTYGLDILKMTGPLSLERIEASEGRSFYYIRPEFEDRIFLQQGGLFIAGGYPRLGDTGGHLFLTLGEFGLQVGDIKPDFTGTSGAFETGGFSSGVFVSGPYAYVADRELGLVVVDVSNTISHEHPMPTQEIGRLVKPDIDWGAEGVFIAARGGNTYAYVAAGDAGLRIVDVTDPTKLTPDKEVGLIPTPAPAKAVFVFGNYTYVAAGDLLVVNVSDPTKPELRGRYDVPGQAIGVQVAGKLAYVVDQTGRLLVVDVSDPDHPTETGRFDTPGQIHGVFVSGGYAYVSDGDGGLLILRHLPSASSGPDLVLDRSNLWFGEVVVGTNQELTFTLRNGGDRDLLISSLGIGGEKFSFVGGMPSVPFFLAPDESQEIRVGFFPTSVGLQSGSVTVISNDPQEGALRIPLAGRGIPAPDIRTSDNALNFGEVASGDSEELEITLFNDGEGILSVRELSVDNARFNIVSPSVPFQVAPGGGSRRVTVRFSPISSDPQNGMLRIISNDPDQGALEISLSGNGVQVQLVINSGAIFTAKRKVTLDLSAPKNVTKVRFSNDGSKWSSWKRASKVKSWRLSKGEGSKQVLGQFKTNQGKVLKTSDTITLEGQEKRKRK